MFNETDLEKNNMTAASPSNLSRRQFLKRMGILGGGIVVYFTIGDPSRLVKAQRFMGPIPKDFNAFLRIGSDGKVTGFTGKIEMGQGPITSLPQMLADELDVAYDSVDIIMGDTDLCPWDMGTFGSMTTRIFGPLMRKAAAEAKGVLKELAADHLKCPLDRLQTKNGVVFDKNRPDRQVTYGELTKGKIIEKHLDTVPPLKSPDEFTIMGKPYLHQDATDKITGKAKYAGDIRFPEMLYASILRPPAHGAKLMKVDTTAAEKIPGVQLIKENDFIAVLHEKYDTAERGIALIKADYNRPQTGINDKTIFDHLLKSSPPQSTLSQNGSIEKGKELSKITFDETYRNSYIAHAPIEPHTAIAKFEGGKVTVWASTQSPFGAQRTIAARLRLPLDKVRVVTPYVGGGFGGKNANGQAEEAAFLAMKTGRPVQVAWSREEEFFLDTFMPAAVVKIKSGVDNEGKITFWEYNVYYAGSRGCEQFYDTPNHLTIAHGQWMGGGESPHPFGVGAWRAPGNNTNAFAREFHINLMASKAGIDPLEFRLKNISDKRMIRVLKAVADLFGWSPAKAPSGRGYGLACGIDAGTYVAHMAEVDVDKQSGQVKVKRVACAQDMGFSVNPQGAKIQMEGCITMGMGYALTEEIRFDNGELFDFNFGTYTIPRFSWVPEIKTVLIENSELPPQGGGEPAIICMGAIIASAIYDQTGAMLFQFPMIPARVKAALETASI